MCAELAFGLSDGKSRGNQLEKFRFLTASSSYNCSYNPDSFTF